MRYSDAQTMFRHAFVSVLQEQPSESELRGLLVVSKHETNFGEAGQFKGSHNMGAIHCGKPPCDPERSFQGGDTLRGKAIRVCFCKYATPFDGALHFVDELYRKRPSVRRAVVERNWRLVAQAMERSKYFVGDPAARIPIFQSIDREAASNLGEQPFPVGALDPEGNDRPRLPANDHGGLLLLLLLLLSDRR